MAPMITRGKDEDDTICHDAHTMALRRANRTHEFNAIMNLRKVFGHFFGMPKILPSLTKLLLKPEKLNRWSYDGFRCPHEWPDVYTIRPEFEHFHNRVSIWCQVRDSVTPALTNQISCYHTKCIRVLYMFAYNMGIPLLSNSIFAGCFISLHASLYHLFAYKTWISLKNNAQTLISFIYFSYIYLFIVSMLSCFIRVF